MHEFTLTVDRDPTDYTDQLFEVANGALTPEGGNGGGCVHVYIDAPSLPAAIVQAVRQIESVGLAVVGVKSDDLVSLRDIADRLGRTYESVRLLATGKRGPGNFPTPLSTGQWSLYSWAAVSEWLGEPSAHDREIAAADHLIRARHMLGLTERQELSELVTA